MPAGGARSPNGSMSWTPAPPKVTVALARIEMGNFSNVSIGVLEYRIDWGPGYRVYFGRDGQKLVIVLAGGTKRP